MRRLVGILFTIIMMMSICGCANKKDTENIIEEITVTKEETTSIITTEEVKEVSDGTTEMVEVKEDKEETTEVSTQVSEQETTEIVYEETDYAVYDVILDEIYLALQLEPQEVEIGNEYFSVGIHETVIACDDVEDRMKSISYGYYDVNMDGVDELIIVETPNQDYPNMRILDMYTIQEGEKVKVIEGWVRNRYYLLDDNTILNSGSGGAAYSVNELFEFEPGASELTSKGMYFTYPKGEDMSVCGFYYSADGIYDVTVATEISEEEYRAFYSSRENRMVLLDLKSFDSYTSE